MPEIKHNFMKGKMNKDLDERLVPDGEYRDAMNIQVSTSEGSDVGAIQNILGNHPGCNYTENYPNPISLNATTIGSVSDEKNDSLYWLVSGLSTISGGNLSSSVTAVISALPDNLTQLTYPTALKDMIMRKGENGCEPVFVDAWGYLQNDFFEAFLDSYSGTLSEITSTGGMYIPDEVIDVIGVGWQATTLMSDASILNTQTVSSVQQGTSIVPYEFTYEPGEVSNSGNFFAASLWINSKIIDTTPCPEIVATNCIVYIASPTSPTTHSFQSFNPENLLTLNLVTTPVSITVTALNPSGQVFNVTKPNTTIASIAPVNFVNNMGLGTEYYKITLSQDIYNFTQPTGGLAGVWDADQQTIYCVTQGGLNFPDTVPAMTTSEFEVTVDWTQPTLNGPTQPEIIIDDTWGPILDGVEVGDEIISYEFNHPLGGTAGATCVSSITQPGGSGDWQLTIDDCAGNILVPNDGYAGQAAWGPGSGSINFGAESTTVFEFDAPLQVADNGTQAEYLLWTNPNGRVLNFNIDKPITGINIVDDMLFWTDNNTEPKKINIPRSIEGTDPGGNKHTRLINPIVGSPPIENYLVEEKHITVIKKPPNRAPKVVSVNQYLSEDSIEIINNDDNTSLPNNAFQGPDGDGVVVGDSVWVLLSSSSQVGLYEVGDILRFSGEPTLILPENYQVRASITRIEKGPYTSQDDYEIIATGGETALLVEILSVSEDAPISSDGINWKTVIEQVGKVLFERKFPRFACRYKYLDNEYSTIGPFTDVVFIPGDFSYEPTRAYNTGMVNNLKSLILQDFIPTDIPEDVIQVDILYKNETNPNIYIIDSITKKDSIPTQSIKNPWNADGSVPASSQLLAPNKFPTTGSYKVSTENIYAALSNDQILRVWDNVPRKALAQEITGNRIVYGNYLQNYSLKNYSNGIPYGDPITPDITVSLGLRTSDVFGNLGKKSIKSLRDYEIGIVWGDKYGRETPVITPSSGSISVPKIRAQRDHFLNLALENSPSWADYYKFYIKETSNEYYNLALGRSYDAEDGNIWLSFPSVDRNKVDEDTYLILKKAIDSEVLVVGDEPAFSGSANPNARYKIVAIENEAPEYIKTTYTNLISTNTDDSRPPNSCELFGGTSNQGATSTECSLPVGGKNLPIPGMKTFTLSGKFWSDTYSSDVTAPAMGLQSPKKVFEEVSANPGKDQLWVEFEQKTDTGGAFSSKYHVVGVELGNEAVNDDDIPTGELADDGYYIINLASPILEADEFVTSGGALVLMNDNIHVHFYKKTIENKPEFDGRFFVKILNDKIAQVTLNRDIGVIANWGVKTTVSVFEVKDDDFENFDNSGSTYNFSGDSGVRGGSSGNSSSTTRTKSDWERLLRFNNGGGAVKSRWFIDKASFASKAGGNTYGTASYMNPDPLKIYPDSSGATIHSCDLTSEIDISYSHDFGSLIGVVSYSLAQLQGIVSAAADWAAGGSSGYDATNLTIGDGSSNGNVGMKGAFTNGTGHYFDLSYSQIKGVDSMPGTDNWGRTENYNIDWEVGVPGGNSYTDEEANVVNNLVRNQRFSFAGNKTVYKILSVQIFNLFNYQGKIHANDEGPKPKWRFLPSFLDNVPGFGASNFWSTRHRDETLKMTDPLNRRKTYRIQYEYDQSNYETYTDENTYTLKPGVDDPLSDPGVQNNDIFKTITNTSPKTLQFLQEYETAADNPIPSNPAIFETEPKEDVDLDLYYEASENFATLPISESNRDLYIPMGSTIVPEIYSSTFPSNVICAGWKTNSSILISSFLLEANFDTIVNTFVKFVRPDGSFTMGFVAPAEEGDYRTTLNVTTNTLSTRYHTLNIIPDKKIGLGWFNCWSFNNGVESNRVGDTYNKPYIINGAKVSTTLDKEYKEENRKYGLIYSGIYNSNSGVNSLNQFISGQKITKDINPTYGSIQKLYSRSTADGDLITLCEDRVLKILANKDALFNADGDINLVATENVLGQAMPYAGEYGISKDPESFASEAYRVYFTDKVRGAVLRLSKDGLTPISDYGMRDWFKDNLKISEKLIGSYDDKKDEYNITLTRDNTQLYYGHNHQTLTFREDVKGWVSFKSFIPENAISCANEYYTFQKGRLWLHHHQQHSYSSFGNRVEVNRNTFYNTHTPTSFEVVLNEAPGTVKTFKTINYEGSQSKIDQLISYNTFIPGTTIVSNTLSDGEYYNLNEDSLDRLPNENPHIIGWYVENITTDLEKGSLNEFIEKEGKWFNYIKGKAGDHNSQDTSNKHFQGLGIVGGGGTSSSISGCTDDTMLNYNNLATVNDGSCIAFIYGCMDSLADAGYNQLANTDNGSCIYYGCTDSSMFNWDPNANTDDGTCEMIVLGSTNPDDSNYNPDANTDDGSGIPTVLGCTDELALNPTAGANTDDGSCCYISGCTDATANNYNQSACSDDNTCNYDVLGCMNPSASNYNASATVNDPNNPCTYIQGCTDDGSLYTDSLGNSVTPTNYDSLASVDDGSCIYPGCTGPTADNYESFYTNDDGSCVYSGCTDSTATNWNPLATIDDGSCVGSGTNPAAGSGCTDNTASNYDPAATTDDGSCIWCDYGCMDATAIGYDPAATCDDGSCGGTAPVYGCMDDAAENYNNLAVVNAVSATDATNPCTYILGCMDNATLNGCGIGCTGALNYDDDATQDDGSCNYCNNGCMDNTYDEYSAAVTCSDPSACITLSFVAIPGCTYTAACNYNSAANVDDGSCTYAPQGADCNGNPGEGYIEVNGVIVPAVYGCMTSSSCNYDQDANVDNGSCSGVPCVPGCMDGNYLEYNSNAEVDDGTCNTLIVSGCTDPMNPAYNSSANVNDGSCFNTLTGCVNPLASNTIPFFELNSYQGYKFYTGITGNTYGVAVGEMVWVQSDPDACEGLFQAGDPGCTDNTAYGYNPQAVSDGGSSCVACQDVSDSLNLTFTADNYLGAASGYAGFGESFTTPLNHLVIRWDGLVPQQHNFYIQFHISTVNMPQESIWPYGNLYIDRPGSVGPNVQYPTGVGAANIDNNPPVMGPPLTTGGQDRSWPSPVHLGQYGYKPWQNANFPFRLGQLTSSGSAGYAAAESYPLGNVNHGDHNVGTSLPFAVLNASLTTQNQLLIGSFLPHFGGCTDYLADSPNNDCLVQPTEVYTLTYQIVCDVPGTVGGTVQDAPFYSPQIVGQGNLTAVTGPCHENNQGQWGGPCEDPTI